MALSSVTVNGVISVRDVSAVADLYDRETEHQIINLARNLSTEPSYVSLSKVHSQKFTLTGSTSIDLTALTGPSGEAITMSGTRLYAAIFAADSANDKDVIIQDSIHVTNKWDNVPRRRYAPGGFDLISTNGSLDTATVVGASNKILYIDPGATGTGNPVFRILLLFGGAPPA